MTKVLVFGTFDIFHTGHEYFLKQARKHGDELIVVVARDKTVKQVKGELPVNDEQARLMVLNNGHTAPYVSRVLLGYEDDKYRIIGELKPDIICLGYDQTSFVSGLEQKLKELGLKTEIKRIDAYMPDLYKSSLFKAKTLKTSKQTLTP